MLDLLPLACQTCFGAPSSPVGEGMVWGIVVLLLVTGGVLFGIAYFMFSLWKRGRVNDRAI